MHRKTAAILILTLTLGAGRALGEGPASQFGFQGWPYRSDPCAPQGTPAATAPASTPTQSPTFPTCSPEIGLPEGPSATLRPTAAPEASPRPTAAPTATAGPSMDEDYTTDSLSAQEQIAWELLCADRAAYGLPALTLDPALSAIARRKCEDMRDQGYFAHESPTYGTVSEMLAYFGYPAASAGENIAHHATVEKAQAAFLSSAGHRRNLLSSAWTKVGIGVCYDAQGYVYVTQLFAR